MAREVRSTLSALTGRECVELWDGGSYWIVAKVQATATSLVVARSGIRDGGITLSKCAKRWIPHTPSYHQVAKGSSSATYVFHKVMQAVMA